METKAWWASKTVWVNVLTTLVAVAGDLSGVFPPDWTPKMLAGIAILNVALRFVTTLPLTVFLLALLCLAVPGHADEPPVGASVRMTNGSVFQCSGTVFSKGKDHAVAVGAAHCFTGILGGEFDIRVAGVASKATLIAHDSAKDLALWKLPASVVREVADFPVEAPQGPMTAIGFPSGATTEHVKKLKYREQYDQGGRFQWKCEVLEGQFANGDSGGGVFLGGTLSGVIHGISQERVCEQGQCRIVTYLHAVCYRDVRDFVNAHQDKWSDCVEATSGKSAPPPPDDKSADTKLTSKPCRCEFCQGLGVDISALKKRLDDLERQSVTLSQSLKEVREPAAPVPGVAGAAGPKGDPGPRGQEGSPGKQGTVTVILIGPDDKEVSRASGVQSGSVVKLNVKRFLKGE